MLRYLFGAVLWVFEWLSGRQKAKEAALQREAGANKQKVADHEGQQEALASGRRAARNVATNRGFRERVRRWATKAGDK